MFSLEPNKYFRTVSFGVMEYITCTWGFGNKLLLFIYQLIESLHLEPFIFTLQRPGCIENKEIKVQTDKISCCQSMSLPVLNLSQWQFHMIDGQQALLVGSRPGGKTTFLNELAWSWVTDTLRLADNRKGWKELVARASVANSRQDYGTDR